MDTIYFTEKMWQFKVLEFATPFGRKFGDMSRKLIWQRSHQGTMHDRDKAIAHYNQHIEDVKAAVAPDRLLVFSADQGWAARRSSYGQRINSKVKFRHHHASKRLIWQSAGWSS